MTRPKTKMREERIFPLTDIEVRAADGDEPPRITGHSAVFNKWSEDLGGFKERVMPGAFTKTIGEADIRSLFNHDPNYVLGRTKAGTLALSEDKRGLAIDVLAPTTDTIRDLVLEPMRRGDIDQASFSFRTVRDEWREPKKEGTLWERDLLEVKLFDVGPVAFPAYVQTDMAVRSMLTDVGIDFSALTALIARAERGLIPSGTDVDLLNGSIDVLRSYLPSEPDDGQGADPAEADAPLTEPQAGRAVVHLRRLLEIRERELAATA